jgi:pyruvate dehydrogenase phosphatase
MVPIAKLAALGSKARPTKQIRSDLGNLHARLRMIHQHGPIAAKQADFVQKNKNGLIAGGVALTVLGSYLAWDRLGHSKALGSPVGVDANVSWVESNLSAAKLTDLHYVIRVGRRKTNLGIHEHTFVPMDHEAAEQLLKLHEITKTFRPSETKSVVTRFDCNHVDCNQAGEDRHMEDFLSKDILSAKSTVATAEDEAWLQLSDADNGSLKLFSVIDGHGGTAVADLLVRRLHPAIVRSLRSAKDGHDFSALDPLSSMRKDKAGVTAFIQSYQPFGFAGSAVKAGRKHDEGEPFTFNADTISDALRCAYTDLDYEVCVQPLKLLSHPSGGNDQSKVQEILSQAVAGACASTVLVDEDRQEVYVANTGDTRVVAGYWVPPRTWHDGTRFLGGWRCEVLTGDHNAKDPVELER